MIVQLMLLQLVLPLQILANNFGGFSSSDVTITNTTVSNLINADSSTATTNNTAIEMVNIANTMSLCKDSIIEFNTERWR